MTSKNKNARPLEVQAKEFFARHYNCAQATFLPFALRCGLKENIAAKMALPFGGGMSHTGQVCGAISGGLLAIGLATGTSEDDPRQKNACYDLSKAFISRFKALHGKISCPGLLGYDLNDPNSKLSNRDPNLNQTPCSKFVEDAVEIVKDLLPFESLDIETSRHHY